MKQHKLFLTLAIMLIYSFGSLVNAQAGGEPYKTYKNAIDGADNVYLTLLRKDGIFVFYKANVFDATVTNADLLKTISVTGMELAGFEVKPQLLGTLDEAIKKSKGTPSNGTVSVVEPPNPIPNVTPSGRIAMLIYSSCREGGFKKKFQFFDGECSISIDNKTPKLSYNLGSNSLVFHNNPSDNIGLQPHELQAHCFLTMKRLRAKDFVREYYDNWCEHDGQSTNCDENTNSLTVSNHYPNIGETIKLTYEGNLLNGQNLNWYGDGYEKVSVENGGKTITARITSLPCHIQAQPSAVTENQYCHGWTAFTVN